MTKNALRDTNKFCGRLLVTQLTTITEMASDILGQPVCG
jgi:hypothetical protein